MISGLQALGMAHVLDREHCLLGKRSPIPPCRPRTNAVAQKPSGARDRAAEHPVPRRDPHVCTIQFSRTGVASSTSAASLWRVALTMRWCAPFAKRISICGSSVPYWFSRWLILMVACGFSLMVGVVSLSFYRAIAASFSRRRALLGMQPRAPRAVAKPRGRGNRGSPTCASQASEP